MMKRHGRMVRTERVARRSCRGAGWALAAVVLLATAARSLGQALRYDYHQELTGSIRYRDPRDYDAPVRRLPVQRTPPDYATLRIGPFYSTAVFTQTAGYRYVRTEGDGANYLYGNRRGRYRKDGSEFPLISRLDLRNYLLITENMDLDVSVSAVYEQYPLNTQEDDFYIDLVDEGLFANISFTFDITPYLFATLYERFTYRTDYIDTRGIEDRYGGTRHRYIQNEVGLSLDWRLSRDRNVVGSLSRTDYLPRDDEFDEQERITYRETLTYWQRVMPELRVGARASFSQTEYTASDRNNWNQADYYLLLDFGKGEETGLGMRLTQFTTARAGIGYSVGYSSQRGATERDGESVERESESRQGSMTGFASLTTALREDLSHTFDFRRGLRTGFNSDYEIYTMYGYSLDWRGAVSSAGLFTRIYEVEPSGDQVSSYRDWQSGVRCSYPLTGFATLIASSVYSIRENNAREDQAGELEDRSDYETWSSRVGTSFSITKNLTFLTYYEHVERYSDASDLTYSRDIFEARFSYRHQF
jgi:hypothetical protein